MPSWWALCLIFNLDGFRPVLVETRVGFGRYDAHRFVHLQADLQSGPLTQPVLGTGDPTVPLMPMRQFLRCRP